VPIPSAAVGVRTIPWSAVDRPRLLLLLLHVPLIAFPAAAAGTGLDLFPASNPGLAGPLAALAGAIQVRHSWAASHGMRPAGWQFTLLLLAILAYAPMLILPPVQWATLQWLLIGSAALLLPPLVAAIVALIAVIIAAATLLSAWGSPPPTLIDGAYALAYSAFVFVPSGVALFSAARLAHALDELRANRAALAELGIVSERLRVAQDVHDLLGQTLSAVALKGDLAIRLLRNGAIDRASEEVGSLTALARDAIHDVRSIASEPRRVTFAGERARAAELLAGVGIEFRMTLDAADIPASVDELFGWATREGVTNVLRHSIPAYCALRVERSGGLLRLLLENDGLEGPQRGGGSGLAGLARRASMLHGRAEGALVPGGRFRLIVEVPEAAQ
jgi:two-component system, NarL family, sensor histidine kinase DesK